MVRQLLAVAALTVGAFAIPSAPPLSTTTATTTTTVIELPSTTTTTTTTVIELPSTTTTTTTTVVELPSTTTTTTDAPSTTTTDVSTTFDPFLSSSTTTTTTPDPFTTTTTTWTTTTTTSSWSPGCSPSYEEYICDDDSGNEYLTTYTVFPTGCPGYTSWSDLPVEATSAAQWDPISSTTIGWEPIATTTSTWSAWDPIPTTSSTWSAWEPIPTTSSTWSAWEAVSKSTTSSKCSYVTAMPTSYCYQDKPDQCWSDSYTTTMYADTCTWAQWSTPVKPTTTSGKCSYETPVTTSKCHPQHSDWCVPVTSTSTMYADTCTWNQWTSSTTEPPKPWATGSAYDNKEVITITFVEVYTVPCSTGWETMTTTIYTTHCGCTETPVPSKPAESTYTTTCPESWGVGSTVTVTVPYAQWTPSVSTVAVTAVSSWSAYPVDASSSWSAYPVDASSTWSAYPVDASSTWSNYPVADTSSTWVTWSTSVAATTTWANVAEATSASATGSQWNAIQTFKGAATATVVSKVMVVVAGAVAGLAFYL